MNPEAMLLAAAGATVIGTIIAFETKYYRLAVLLYILAALCFILAAGLGVNP